MDIAGIAARAREFRARLDAVKAGVPHPFEWYPYDSLSSFDHLNNLLTGPNRNLLDLAGRRPVLDIGCADGDVSFLLESLGCAVHAIDNPGPNRNRMRGVRTLKAALGSAVEICELNLDDRFDLPCDEYGLALFLGTLYHVRNPFYVLGRLSVYARHCVLSTRIAQRLPDGGDIRSQPVAYLLDRGELNSDGSNYWIFSEAGLRRLLARSGWDILDWHTCGATDCSDPIERDERAFCLLKSRYTLGHHDLLEGWHKREGDGWRWTERCFSVAILRLREFELQGFISEDLIARFGSITLSASVDGVEVTPETYASPGEYVFRRSIPAGASERVVIRFVVSQALSPDDRDRRERGIIVNGLKLI